MAVQVASPLIVTLEVGLVLFVQSPVQPAKPGVASPAPDSARDTIAPSVNVNVHVLVVEAGGVGTVAWHEVP